MLLKFTEIIFGSVSLASFPYLLLSVTCIIVHDHLIYYTSMFIYITS